MLYAHCEFTFGAEDNRRGTDVIVHVGLDDSGVEMPRGFQGGCFESARGAFEGQRAKRAGVPAATDRNERYCRGIDATHIAVRRQILGRKMPRIDRVP